MTSESTLQTRILTRQNMDRGEVLTLEHGTVAIFSARSPAKETDNEDAAAVIPIDANRAVLAVADGVGGHAAGADAAAHAIEAIVDGVAGTDLGVPDLRSAILNGFELGNERVSDMGLGAGTTLSVAEINGTSMRPYHVGDSEILVVGQRGKVKLQTVSHSPVAYAVEAGLIEAAEAIHHEDRHLVSNVVGCSTMRIEVGAIIDLRPRDTVVLGSDGLFDNLHAAEVVEAVRKGPLTAIADRLHRACHDRMLQREPGHPSKADDLTFIVYRPHVASAR